MSNSQQNQNRPDVFDRLMALPGLRLFNGFYTKNKSVLLYIFFGGFTTLISISSFMLFVSLGINELVANIMSWILAVLFAYVTNRIWVFRSGAKTWKRVVQEAASFFGGRLMTLGLEEILLLVFITWLGFDSVPVKIAAQGMVLILNYIISKVIIFRQQK